MFLAATADVDIPHEVLTLQRTFSLLASQAGSPWNANEAD